MGNNNYKHTHRDKGLCVNCSCKALPGLTRCVKHNISHNRSQMSYDTPEASRLRNKSTRLKRKLSYKCTRCGAPLNPDVDEGKFNCINCRERVK